MTYSISIPDLIGSIRSRLAITQTELARRLGVSFATVNRWEGGLSKPQRAQQKSLYAMAAEAGVPIDNNDAVEEGAILNRSAKSAGKTREKKTAVPTTKPMEQMLWDAACSIRGEKDAAKFKDYLLPLLFLKRLSDVFDDEISRLAEEYGDRDAAMEIVESDHDLVRFYIPPEARWQTISGRETVEWPADQTGLKSAPKDIGEHLTRACRAVASHNPTLYGVIDIVDFAAERNGERDINPSRLKEVVETFSDPRYRLGLADVEPDFLGRAYEYLLRKFAEGSGQSAGEFFTPTEVGFLIAWIMRPRPGESCHDYACGSGGLLIKQQLVARELDPTSRLPLKLSGQELQAESYAVARMNAIIHDMEVELMRGDTMINPKFRDEEGHLRQNDIVVANPMWNQPIAEEIYKNDPYGRFLPQGGATTRDKADWGWLQHTLACMNENGRGAVVLDTGAVTRGSGSRNEDRERNIRKWFVEHDYIDGVILLPDNLFYNTNAAGVVIVLNKNKPEKRKNRIILFNAQKRARKGRPKNYLPAEEVKEMAALFNKGEDIAGEIAVIDKDKIVEADYNLSPSRWVGIGTETVHRSIDELVNLIDELNQESIEIWAKLQPSLCKSIAKGNKNDQNSLE